ncbi:MAG: hypothetical protein Q8K19_03060 [Methylicorpusculum sp.]|uniref:hypothetical protein n=1 Tax=Methylicorpusculum sp. TaxID=2713644 RepID=UPI002730584A|nr:hypothetical protein [Methylicorpusculum sp.]MDP2177471.1 hypothetical protein [Methylicorpusculum sp.]
MFVIVAHGVFVAYQLCDGALTPEAINQKVRQLRDEWRDSARLLSVLVEALQTKQRQIQLLQARLNRVAGVIETSRRHRSGDSLTGIFDHFREEKQRLAKGDDPLEVLTWVLQMTKPRQVYGAITPVLTYWLIIDFEVEIVDMDTATKKRPPLKKAMFE